MTFQRHSVADINYMKDVKLEYYDCSIYRDKGYIGADIQLDLFETAHINLNVHTDSIKKHGNRHSFHLQRQKK